MTEEKAPRSQTLDRGLAVLELLGSRPTGLGVSEIARALGLHRSIVYRLVRTLEDRDFVTRDGDTYHLGLGLMSLRSGVAADLGALATPELRLLADELGYATFVVLRSGAEVVTLVVVEPTDPGPMFTMRVGQRHPVDQGAPGRAVLTCEPARPGEDPRVTLARSQGWAGSRSEVLDGVDAVAAPLHAYRSPAAVATSWVGAGDQQVVAQAVVAAAGRIDDRIRRSGV